MIDPDDPRQAKRYRDNGIAFIASVIVLFFMLLILTCYIYINRLY